MKYCVPKLHDLGTPAALADCQNGSGASNLCVFGISPQGKPSCNIGNDTIADCVVGINTQNTCYLGGGTEGCTFGGLVSGTCNLGAGAK